MKVHSAVSFAVGFGMVLLCYSIPAVAATYTWNANTSGAPVDGSGTWNTTSTNWYNGSDVAWPNTSTNVAVFGAGSGAGPAGPVTLGGLITTGSLTFNTPGSGTYLLTAGTLDVGGTTPTITVNASSGTIASVLETTNNLTMLGKGALYLTGSAVYTGSTKISGSGALYIDGSDSTSSITVNTGGTLGGSGSASSATVTLSNKSTIDAGSGGQGSLTLAGLTISDNATLRITNVGNYSSGTAAINVTGNNGFIEGGATTTFSLAGAPPTGSGTAELLQCAGTIQGSLGNFNLSPNFSPAASSRAVFSLTTTSQNGYSYIDLNYQTDYPVWTGSGDCNWFTSGNLTVSGTTNWVSALSGTATNFIANDSAVFADTFPTASGTSNVASSAVNINSGNVSPSAVTFNNNLLNYTISSSAGYGIAGTGPLTMKGSAAVTITNSNSYSGGTTVYAGSLSATGTGALGTGLLAQNGGTVSIGAPQSVSSVTLNAGLLNVNNNQALGSGTLTLSSGTIDNASGGPVTLTTNNPLAWNGNFTFGGSNPLNLGTGNVTLGGSASVYVSGSTLTLGAIGGGGVGFTQNGSGLLALTGSSGYTGPTAVNGGTLSVGNGGGGASINGTSGVALAANTTLLFNHTDAVSFVPAISGPGGVVQAGGMLSLANSNNSYTGGTTVSGGTLQANSTGSLGPAGGALTIASGGLVDLNGLSASIAALNGNGVIDNVTAGGSPVLTLGGGANATFSGTIQNTTGSVALVKAGAGVQTLSGTGTFSGGTQITGGTLNVGSATALQQSTVTVSANNSLTFSGLAATLGGLSGSGNVNLGSTTLTVGGNNTSTNYSGALTGAGGLTKTGSGTLTLAAGQSYGGATHISGGVLQVQQLTGAPPSSLPVTAGLQYWLDASNPSSVSGPTVLSWNDLGGNGNSFTVASGGTAPTLVPNALNGLPMVQFNGTTNALVDGSAVNAETVFIVTTPSTSQARTLTGVWGYNYPNDGGIRLGDVAGTWRGWPQTSTTTDQNDFAGETSSNSGVPLPGANTYITTSGSFDANTTNFGSLGTPQILAAYGSGSGTNALGGYYNGVTGGRDYAGNVGEVLVYNTQLSAVQRQDVESYLDFKWLGVSVPLPGAANNALPATTPMTISNGGTFDMTNGTQTIASLSSTDGNGSQVLLGGAGMLTIAGSATTTFDGVISGAGGSVTLQGGRLTFTGANAYGGLTTVSAGTLQLGDGASKTGSVAGNIVNNSAIVFATPASQLQVFNGAISGSGSLTMNGPGVLQLSATHSYTGPTVINQGTLRLSVPGMTVSGFGSNTTGSGFTTPITNGTWTFNSYSYDAGFNNTPVTNNAFDLTDGSTGGGTGAGCARDGFYDTPVPVNTSFKTTFTYTPGRTGSNYGTGMSFILTSTANINSLSGAGRGFGVGYCPEQTVAGQFADGDPISPSVNLNFDVYGGTNSNYGNPPGAATGYNTNGGTTTLDSIFGGDTYAPGNPINMTVTYNAQTDVLSWSGIDTVSNLTFSESQAGVNLTSLTGGTSALIGFGGGATFFTSYQTITNFSYQQITGGGTNVLPTTTDLTISNSGTLDLNGASQTLGSLSGGTGAVVLASGPLTVGGDGASTTFAGTITGNGALYKTGPGTFVLSGTSTLGGAANVYAGILEVDGSLTANVMNILDASQLAGVGTISTTGDSLYYNTTASSTFSGSIVGSQGLEVDQGSLVLAGSNSFTGGTLVAGGSLILEDSDALAAGTSLTVGDALAFSPIVPLSGTAITPVPEPGAVVLLAGMAAAVAGAGLRRIRRRRPAQRPPGCKTR